MNCPGIFLFVLMLQAGKTLSVYLPNPFFTPHHRKPNSSVCSGDLPLLPWPGWQKHTPANPVWLGTQILPLPVQPSSTSFLTSHKGGAKQFRAALVPAPRVSGFCLLKTISSLLLSVLGTECDTLMIQQAPNFRIWSPETQCCKVVLSVCQTIPIHSIICSYSAAPNPCHM